MMLYWKRYAYIVLLTFLFIGLFIPVLGLVAIICMIAPIIVSFIRGRYWCGNLCPRGNFYDQVLTRKNKRQTPQFFSNQYVRLGVIIFLFANMALGIYLGDGSLKSIGLVLYRLILLTTLIGILLGSIFNHRTWCKVCPMGTLSSYVSRFRNHKNKDKLLTISASCTQCKACSKQCPMDVTPHTFINDTITHHDCINCKICKSTCPKDAIQ